MHKYVEFIHRYIIKKRHDSCLKVKVMDASTLIFHSTPHAPHYPSNTPNPKNLCYVHVNSLNTTNLTSKSFNTC